MQVGVSTSSLYPMETEAALCRLAHLGISRAEVFLNSRSEASPQFARLLSSISKDEGIAVTALHPYCTESEGITFFGRYPRRFEDGVEEYRRMFEACAVVGAEYLVFHGAKKTVPVPEKFYFERFAKLAEEGKRFGVKLCQENVARCMSHDPGFISRMRRALPKVSFVLDTKQALRAGVPLDTMLDAMGDNLRRVHISEKSPLCDCVPPGKGDGSLAPFVNSLKKRSFDGELMIELYRWNFEREEELSESKNYLENLIAREG